MALSDYLRFDLCNVSDCATLEKRFGLVIKTHGVPNLLYCHPSNTRLTGLIQIDGQGNRIIFGQDCSFQGSIFATGSNARAMIHGSQHQLQLQLTIYSGAHFEIGKSTVAYGLRAWVGDRTSLAIGAGCLISEGVTIRTTDHHTIFNLESLVEINRPASVKIGPCVWLGQDVAVLKGVEIGSGSIVGARATVSRSIPNFELWAGSPAKMLRQNVSWTDIQPADRRQMADRLNEIQSLKS